jgi:hypothetical protein
MYVSEELDETSKKYIISEVLVCLGYDRLFLRNLHLIIELA